MEQASIGSISPSHKRRIQCPTHFFIHHIHQNHSESHRGRNHFLYSSSPQRMHRKEDDDSSSSPSICQRLFRFVVAKLGILGEKEMNKETHERNKLTKKGSRSDITIHFKHIEDSEDNKINSSGSSSQESERETVIILANGINGPKKRLHEKGKTSMLSEPERKQQISQPEAGKPPQPHRGLRPLLHDINKKSDAFIESTLEKMRKSLA